MNHEHSHFGRTEISRKLGYFPAFLIPATDSSLVFRSLVRQTLSAYINNPLPKLFKEKLFVCLSRYFGISYFTICHSCTLYSLGISTTEILALEAINPPESESDITEDLELLHLWRDDIDWNKNTQLETSLLRCSYLIFLQPSQTDNCTKILKELLGTVDYNYLLILLGYIQLCHQWIIDHPEISHQQDRRSQLYLGSLLLSDIRLKEFLQANLQLESWQKTPFNKLSFLIENDRLLKQAVIACMINAPFPVMIYAENGEVLYLNSNWIEATGYKASEITTLTQWKQKARVKQLETDDWLTPDTSRSPAIADQSQNMLQQIATSSNNVAQISDSQTNIAEAIQIIITTSSGEQRFWESYSTSLQLSNEQLTICIIKDITDVVHYQKLIEIESQLEAIQQSARENLNLSEVEHRDRVQPNIAQFFQELKNVVDVLPFYLCVTDIYNQTISLVNLKLARSLGLSNPELARGKIISECFPPEYTRQIIWQQQQVLTYGKELNFREEVMLADGIHYFDTTIAPLHDNDGKIYALLHTSNDVRDLTTTKEALSQRTIQLEAANKELESFSYSVSHDLQKPLRAINGFSQVLCKNYQSSLDDLAKHYLERIQNNSQQMSDLIDALLRLSRVTRSQMKLVKVNLSQIAQNVFEQLQTNEPKRRVEFVNTSNVIAKGDPQLLSIVMSNLLDNAWKYTSKRSLAKIEFNYKLGIDDQKIYFVKDNGAGFDLEYADKLFTAFHRLHSQEEFPGTGIGLATVQRIIYRHGGKVWAEAERDRGATIYFSLC